MPLEKLNKRCCQFICQGISIFLLCVLFVYTQAQTLPYNIKYLGIDQGLSNNSVRCIYQDHRGFMWFGTYDGLNCYDGYQFRVMRNKLNDTGSLPHNYIYTIYEDAAYNLWVGTGQGIGIYNARTNRFAPAYYIPVGRKKPENIRVSVNEIGGDAAGNIFIATNGQGLLLLQKGSTVAIPVACDAAPPDVANVQTLLVDKQGRVWVFINAVGLCRYDYTAKKIVVANRAMTNCLSMAADSSGNLWLGGNTGLYKYNIAANLLQNAYAEGAGKLSSNTISSLQMEGRHQLWIGTEGGGINILNLVSGELSYLSPGREGASLSSESASAIYTDKESRKWIGTLKGGINIIDPVQRRFRSFAHDPLNANSLGYNFVSSFYEDDKQQLWIGTDGGGMSIWNRAQNSFTNFKHVPGVSNPLTNNLVTSITRDHTGMFWIATFGGGIVKYNCATGAYEHYACLNPLTGEDNKNVWLVYQDRGRELWATTFARGRMYHFNRAQNRFEMFGNDLTDLISLHEDAAGNFWGGNSFSLIKIDRQLRRHKVYDISKPVRAIFEDSRGKLWLGTEGGGLILFDRATGAITARYSDADGLCNNAVLNILEDGQGKLWLSTFNGLSEFDVATKTFKNYYQADGLQSNQFLYNAALRLRSGELVFGGIKGFTIFHPDSLQLQRPTAPVFITSIRVNNKTLSGEDAFVSGTSGDAISSLTVPYDEAVVGFDFAVPEYTVPGKILYAYYLEGWDKGWNYSGAVRTASYTNLTEGSYKLHIKSTNAAGEWSGKETILALTILPPWYRSWWAYIIYISMAGLLVYLYLGYRTRQTRLEYEVKLAHLETEKEKELNEKKLSFFTDMSHEFRTPLTLIINPVKDVLNRGGQKHETDNLNIVYRNARRLLSLVDQLLLFRKADTEGDRLKISRVDFTGLCRDVYLCFVQEARMRKIRYDLHCPDELFLYCDPQKVEIALYNLLSNAIKYTPVGGEIDFAVEEKGDALLVRVADNGPGIPAADGEKIFGKFYQVINEKQTTKPGFGIGLYLVKSVVEKHHGSIRYESEPGGGTTFFVELPVGKAHFAGEVIREDEIGQYKSAPEKPADTAPAVPDTEKLEELLSLEATLLIIDDNDQLRQYLLGIFSGKYRVYEAASAEEGLELARKQLPDLVISDIVMKGMTGTDLCAIIKQDPVLGHIPVILLTATDSPEGRLKGIEHGADDYITKPFEKELLEARVANLLKNRTVLQNYFYNEITLQQNNLKISAEYKQFLEHCIAIVEKHLDDKNFSIRQFAMEIGMSHSNLYKKVKSISGQSVNSFIRFIRLRKAAELFIHSNLNVFETATQVGIHDVKYFREQFNKVFGMNPSEYIKKYRKAFSSNYRVNKDVFE